MLKNRNAIKVSCGAPQPGVTVRYGQHASQEVRSGFVLPKPIGRLLLLEVGDAKCQTVNPLQMDYNNPRLRLHYRERADFLVGSLGLSRVNFR